MLILLEKRVLEGSQIGQGWCAVCHPPPLTPYHTVRTVLSLCYWLHLQINGNTIVPSSREIICGEAIGWLEVALHFFLELPN
jgi:hypothetical protein